MEQSYWDRLEWIIKAAQMLQRHPVPGGDEDDNQIEALQATVNAAKSSLQASLAIVRGHGELWCGDRNDPMRGSMIPAADWDWLSKNI